VINFQSKSNFFTNLIQTVLFDFLFSRCDSAAVEASNGRFEDIRRKKFLKLILLPALANDVSDERSISFDFLAAVSLNLIGDEMFRATGNLTFWFRFG
jgi:hypothetical protein